MEGHPLTLGGISLFFMVRLQSKSVPLKTCTTEREICVWEEGLKNKKKKRKKEMTRESPSQATSCIGELCTGRRTQASSSWISIVDVVQLVPYPCRSTRSCSIYDLGHPLYEAGFIFFFGTIPLPLLRVRATIQLRHTDFRFYDTHCFAMTTYVA